MLEANLEASNPPLVATSIIVLCGSLNLWHMFCDYLLMSNHRLHGCLINNNCGGLETQNKYIFESIYYISMLHDATQWT